MAARPEGDLVEITECRPISKTESLEVTRVVEKARLVWRLLLDRLEEIGRKLSSSYTYSLLRPVRVVIRPDGFQD